MPDSCSVIFRERTDCTVKYTESLENIAQIPAENQAQECPPFRKHRLRKNYRGKVFLNCRNPLHEIPPRELFSGRLRSFVVARCFRTVFVACFQESICAMAIWSLRQNISEELFLAVDCAKFV